MFAALVSTATTLLRNAECLVCCDAQQHHVCEYDEIIIEDDNQHHCDNHPPVVILGDVCRRTDSRESDEKRYSILSNRSHGKIKPHRENRYIAAGRTSKCHSMIVTTDMCRRSRNKQTSTISGYNNKGSILTI